MRAQEFRDKKKQKEEVAQFAIIRTRSQSRMLGVSQATSGQGEITVEVNAPCNDVTLEPRVPGV